MHNPKSFTALLVALGLVVCSGGNSLLMGGQTDLPHQTHLHFLRGPGMGGNGSPCWNCHTSGSPGTGNVNWSACEPCHSPGGAFDGVQMAKDNWGSGVYEAGAILIIRPSSLLVLLT